MNRSDSFDWFKVPLICTRYFLNISVSENLLLQACDWLVFRLFSANSKSFRADLISALPRITAMSAWFFNNPPAAFLWAFPMTTLKEVSDDFWISKFLYGFSKIPEASPAFILALATVAELFVHDSDIIIYRVQVFWYWLLDIMYKVLVVFFVRWYNVKMFAYYVYFFRSTRHTIHL